MAPSPLKKKGNRFPFWIVKKRKKKNQQASISKRYDEVTVRRARPSPPPHTPLRVYIFFSPSSPRESRRRGAHRDGRDIRKLRIQLLQMKNTRLLISRDGNSPVFTYEKKRHLTINKKNVYRPLAGIIIILIPDHLNPDQGIILKVVGFQRLPHDVRTAREDD